MLLVCTKEVQNGFIIIFCLSFVVAQFKDISEVKLTQAPYTHLKTHETSSNGQMYGMNQADVH